jgi:3-hydroxypropanoate dehydrogenase
MITKEYYMSNALNAAALEQLFSHARTHNVWLDTPVSDAQLQAIYDQVKWGPTAANCTPARFVFVKSAEAKAKLAPALDEGNRAKTLQAPVNVIVATDFAFYEQLPKLFPHADARSWFAGNQALIESTAVRNGNLQGGYFILAARAMGLDCGPMSGFNNAMVDEAFFAGTTFKSNFLINLGYGDAEKLFPRSPRLAFDDACRIL